MVQSLSMQPSAFRLRTRTLCSKTFLNSRDTKKKSVWRERTQKSIFLRTKYQELRRKVRSANSFSTSLLLTLYIYWLILSTLPGSWLKKSSFYSWAWLAKST